MCLQKGVKTSYLNGLKPVVSIGFPLVAALTVQPPHLTTMRTILSNWTQPKWFPAWLSLSFHREYAL
jgi:hypothetical protein